MKSTTCSLTPPAARALATAIAIAVLIAVAGSLTPHGIAAAAAPSRALPAEESSATTCAPLPLQMATTAGCQQLLIATGRKLGSTTGTLTVFDQVGGVWVEKLDVPARFGKRGLIDGTKRKAGSNTTPTGIWSMPNFIFGTHLHAPAGTKMAYRRMTRKSWWSSKRGKTYNAWVEARHWTGEYIAGSPKAYEFAVSMGYNARPNPSVFGRGSGIFLHVRGTGLTAGCVAIARADMIRVCKILDRGKRPHFAVGTLQLGTPTSIWAY